MPTGICKPSGYLRQRISGQILAMSLEWAHWCKYMDIDEFNLKRSKGGQKDKMIILGKEGGLTTSDECEDISLDPGSYNIGNIPYFTKVSKIRDVIYCAECLCTRETYTAWRNMSYRAGYAETMIGGPRRHMATSGLEHVGRFSGIRHLELPSSLN